MYLFGQYQFNNVAAGLIQINSCFLNVLAGVTTIAGGKSNIAGYRDGPSEDAKFSTDFDLMYVPSTCSLLVVDRGNAALRQIALNQEDCDTDYSSIAMSGGVHVVYSCSTLLSCVFIIVHDST